MSIRPDFLQLTSPISPVTNPGGVQRTSFGASQPLDNGFDRSAINFNPFGQISPIVTDSQKANKFPALYA
ncbi:MAG TPA: hypothetical protein P5556_08770 [Candidatus Gastranaerophilales bacterium]|nr:hypothetical protein [Candidatus Gastranaerophilales bacterium]